LRPDIKRLVEVYSWSINKLQELTRNSNVQNAEIMPELIEEEWLKFKFAD